MDLGHLRGEELRVDTSLLNYFKSEHQNIAWRRYATAMTTRRRWKSPPSSRGSWFSSCPRFEVKIRAAMIGQNSGVQYSPVTGRVQDLQWADHGTLALIQDLLVDDGETEQRWRLFGNVLQLHLGKCTCAVAVVECSLLATVDFAGGPGLATTVSIRNKEQAQVSQDKSCLVDCNMNLNEGLKKSSLAFRRDFLDILVSILGHRCQTNSAPLVSVIRT